MGMLSIGMPPFYICFVLMFTSVTRLVSVLGFCPSCCSCGDVTPTDPYILTGQQLLLYCHLHNETIQSYPVNSSHVYFEKGRLPIPQNNVIILNESTAMLNITINELSDKSTYYCILESDKKMLFNNMSIVGRQVVTVEYYPQKIPEDSVYCIVYDWDINLTCYWKKPEIKYADESNIETKVYWKNHDSFIECKHIENNYCTLSRKNGISIDVGSWTFKFEVTNNKKNATSTSYYHFMDYNFVKPSPVSLFESGVLNSSCVRLTWTHPRKYRQKFYEISYKSKWDKQMQKVNTSIDATAEVICDLIPHTVYNFTISVYPNEKSGYRSEPVQIKAQTKEDIPDIPPEMTEGSYIGSLDNCAPDIKYRNVTLYWKAIPERYVNGKLKGYMITYKDDGSSKTKLIKPYKTSEKIQVRCDHSYQVKLKAETVAGFTKDAASLKVLSVSKKDIKPPKVIPVLEDISNHTLNVSWSSASHDRKVTGYTVYWCPYTNKFICDREISWSHVNGNESSLKIQFENAKGTYLFGVSMETNVGSSGFSWDSCLYLKNAVPVPPKVAFGQSPPNKGLTVTWSADYCNTGSPYIIGYKVRYCEINKEYKTCEGHVIESKLILTDTIQRYDIHDLDSSKFYGVSVRSVSWNSQNTESPDSEMIFDQPYDSNLKPGAMAGIAIAGIFVSCLAVAGLIFCYRICKTKSAEIRKPYEIEVPIIKSQMNGNGNLITYTNISEPSSPVESHQLLNGFINGGVHINGGIQKQISRDSGHESIASETPNTPSPDQVVNKSNELLLPVKEESDFSSNSNVLSSKCTEESSLSERPRQNNYYSQVALLMSESDDSSLMPSSNLTDEGQQNPVFVNSNPPPEKIFTVAHVTSVQLDNENPFYPNSKKSLLHDQPDTMMRENLKDHSIANISVSPYVKADMDSESTSDSPFMEAKLVGNMLVSPDTKPDLQSESTSVSPYVKGDLCSESTSVSPYVKGDICSGNASVSSCVKGDTFSENSSALPYVQGDICSGNVLVSPYVKDDMCLENSSVSPYVKGDICSENSSVSPYVQGDICSDNTSVSPCAKVNCSANTSVSPYVKDDMCSENTSVSHFGKDDMCSGNTSVSPYMSDNMVEGSEKSQLGLVQKNDEIRENVSKDVLENYKTSYEDFVNPLFDTDLYESDESVNDYVLNAGIETSADGKDSVSDYVTKAEIQTLPNQSSVGDYVKNAEIQDSENRDSKEGCSTLTLENPSSLHSDGNITNLDLSYADSENAQNKVDIISEMADVAYVSEVPKTDNTDSIDTSSN